MIKKLTRQFCVALAIITLAVPAALADTQEGAMSGTVVDESGTPMPGVTVTVSGPNLQGERKAITDADGKWRIPLVPVGPGYQVTAYLDGFQRVIQTEVLVNIGETERVDFTLTESSGDLGEITVTAEAPLIDAKRTSISETITYEFMEDVPTGRTYFDAMIMAAGVAGFGNVFTHGADDTDNVFLIDGVDTTDNSTGTFGMNFSYEAIQEVEMKTGGFEAEYGRATGSIANVVTKSGGNEFHGTVPLYYTNLDLKMHQSADRGAVEEEDQYEVEPAANLGGPIVRDKLWFFASYNNMTRRITGVNAFDEEIKRSEIFEEWMAKLTWQLNPDNKLVGQYASDPATIDSRDSLNPNIMSSAYTQQEQGGDLYKLGWTSIFTPNLFMEVKVAHHEVNLTNGPANATPGLDGDLRIIDYQNGAGQLIYGNSAQLTDIHRPRDQFQAVLNYYKGEWGGEHNFKVGTEYQDFTYDEDAIYANQFTINQVVQGEPVDDIWVQTTPLLSRNTGDILTLFAQDSWTFNDNWTFNLGLRWERQTQTYQEEDGSQVDAYKLNNMLAPRLGVTWDVRGDGRSKAYFNYGRYYDAVGTYMSQTLNRSSNYTYTYTGTFDPDDPFNPDNWTLVSTTGGAENTSQIDPNLDPSFKDEVVVGYEFEFLTDFSAGIKGIYNWQDNLIEDIVGNEAEVKAGETNDFWYYITNVESAEREYKGLELQLKKRLSNNYQFLLVYTLSEAKGSVANEGQGEGVTRYADIQELIYNRYGYLPYDDRHYVKLNGSYHLPWGIVAGTGFGWRSGRPYERLDPIGTHVEGTDAFNFYGSQYYLDPRGSHRIGSVWWCDLRLSKDFNIKDTELSVIVDWFNVVNNQKILHRVENNTANWGTPDAWMAAGNVVLGLKYSF